MNCSPTITAQEFSKIHNGLCDLRTACDRLEGVLSPELYQILVRAKNQIREGLNGAYEQDDRAFTSKNNHYESVQKDLGLRDSTWSMYEVNDLNDTAPYTATTVTYRDHWGGKPVVRPIVGSTWAALWVAANACIRDSGDEHHVFIENFRQEGDTLVLSTGS